MRDSKPLFAQYESTCLSLQGWCINTCKEKANEIMAAARAIHSDAILRVVSSFLSSGANVNF